MKLQAYLKDPCGSSSLPYWKIERVNPPAGMRVIHQRAYDVKLLQNYVDEPYFRLIHDLESIAAQRIDGIYTKTAGESDIPLLVEIINRSYEYLSVNEAQVRGFQETGVYDRELWLLAVERSTGKSVGCALADLDREVPEGILEWVQVLPEYRRRGIGRLMVNELLSRMKEKGAQFVTVSGRVNDASCPEQLYRSCGFQGRDVWHVLVPR